MDIIQAIEMEFKDPDERRAVWVMIMSYIFRLFKDYYGQLEQYLPPAVVGGPAQGMTAVVPPFCDIWDRIAGGNIEGLTRIPAQLPATPELTPQVQTCTQPLGAKNQNQNSSKKTTKECKQDIRPDQNPNLKVAWSSGGWTSVFGKDSPFYYENSPTGKVVIPSNDPSQHICLPMCLCGICYDNCGGKHGVLSNAEVKQVAEKGGLNVQWL